MKHNQGFTLLEIIISLLLIGISLSFILHTSKHNLQTKIKTIAEREATALLKEKIEEFEIDNLNSLSLIKGEETKNTKTFFWQILKTPFKPQLTQITITVSWIEDRLIKQKKLVTLYSDNSL